MKLHRPVLALVVASSVARADLATDIQAIVDAEMAARNVAGAVVGVWQGGQPVTVFARGFADIGGNVPSPSNRVAANWLFMTTRCAC